MAWDSGMRWVGRVACGDVYYLIDVEEGTRTDRGRAQACARGGQQGTLRAGCGFGGCIFVGSDLAGSGFGCSTFGATVFVASAFIASAFVGSGFASRASTLGGSASTFAIEMGVVSFTSGRLVSLAIAAVDGGGFCA